MSTPLTPGPSRCPRLTQTLYLDSGLDTEVVRCVVGEGPGGNGKGTVGVGRTPD